VATSHKAGRHRVAEITTLFFDVGGVLATNGWDRHARRNCVESFELDWDEYQDRHEFVADSFETGAMTIDDYLDRTVFYRDRDFTRSSFIDAMKGESQADPEALELVERLAKKGDYLLATLNNESRELNAHRVEAFGLRRFFAMFLTSGYLGVKKPDERIYRLALDISQRDPRECVFIDDRSLNLECAASLGMNGVRFETVEQLETDLAGLGVTT
jgi:putative hydrolase of the HAD superfamily